MLPQPAMGPSVIFGAVSLPLVNPVSFLPTCHFSCATETQLDWISLPEGCVFTKFHSSRVHYMTLESNQTLFWDYFIWIPCRNSQLRDEDRFEIGLFCPDPSNWCSSEKCDLNPAFVSKHILHYTFTQPRPVQSSSTAGCSIYTRCQYHECGPLTRFSQLFTQLCAW